jgi:hypothetical protein
MSEGLSDRELARLLSGRDSPSALDKEAVFERVMAETPARRRRRWAAFAVPLAAAAAVVLAVLAVPREAAFGPKGAGLANLELSCVRGEAPAPCAPGATLVFDVTPPAERPYFAAFARRPDGAIVWYRPAPGERTARASGVLEAGVHLGPEHPPGRYAVFGVFTAEPMARAELRAALGDELASNDRVTVVRRPLEVREGRP